MNSDIKELAGFIAKFLTNRLFLLFFVFCVVFYGLTARLFDLQIINGQYYNETSRTSITKPLRVTAPRGNIYDRYGRPLAINQSAFTVVIDPSATVEDFNVSIYALIQLMEKNGDAYVDDFPISKDQPYVFLFNDSKKREQNWKKNMGFADEEMNATAAESLTILRKKFDLDKNLPGLPDSEARKILSLRSTMYLQRYSRYQPITVAFGVKDATAAAVEEQADVYQGIYVDVDSLREYPQGSYCANLLGYIGKINSDDWDQYSEQGYQQSDLVGRSGMEKSFEKELKGKDGQMLVEVNATGRRISVIKEPEPVQGHNVYTTLDAELQRKSTDILVDTIRQIVTKELQTGAVPLKRLFTGMTGSNALPAKDIMAETERKDDNSNTASYNIRSYVLENKADANTDSPEALTAVKDIICYGINEGAISSQEILLALFEQGVFTGEDSYVDDIRSGRVGPLAVVLNKLEDGQLTPQMCNIDPCSGSAMVVEVKTGDVLAAVGYPNYDNNELVNNFNSEYYNKLNTDPTSPMYNRPFMETRAPGSTFKMISAIAGLETGTITANTMIHDYHEFTTAGPPYPKCWSAIPHGNLTVAEALEVSCNYFFYEMSYRMGNAKAGNKLDSIEALNKYMTAFGLADRSGVEIGEWHDSDPEGIPSISSPEYKKYVETRNNPDASAFDTDWQDGDTIRTAIGQYLNSYTTANMVKYIATLASRGQRRPLHLMERVETQSGSLVEQYQPTVEETVELKDSTWDTIYQGMLLVTGGPRGTARNIFKDYPITVAGKTGTAQEDTRRLDHTSFGGFAPYEDPQIAVYVSIPFGDTKLVSAAASQVARDIISEYMGLNQEPERPAAVNALTE